MIINTKEDIENLRAAGAILGGALNELSAAIRPGLATAELDLMAEDYIRSRGGVPSFLNYKPAGARIPYPAALCISINDEVVHGIPSKNRILTEGDIVSIDLGLSYNGYFVDAARTLLVGKGDAAAHELIAATKLALDEAIAAARVGGHTGDIGAAVAAIAKEYKLGVVKDLGGHGVGRAVHEKPYIDNEGEEGEGAELPDGIVLAIEPMLAEGKGDIVLCEDDWTYKMEDGGRAAHFEDTVIVTAEGAEIITRL